MKKLEYQTYESLSYESKKQRLNKTAWVYLPYGYTAEKQYNVLYLSHGGWSNETTLMGTPDSPHAFKHIMDHAIEDGKIKPLIIVLPTYNNTSPSDSGDYITSCSPTSSRRWRRSTAPMPKALTRQDWQRPEITGGSEVFPWVP